MSRFVKATRMSIAEWDEDSKRRLIADIQECGSNGQFVSVSMHPKAVEEFVQLILEVAKERGML